MRVIFATLCVLFASFAFAESETYQTGENWVTRFVDAGGDVMQVTGFKPSEKGFDDFQFVDIKAEPDLPAAFDWRTEIPGGLMAVKNQGSCGSCWAFSITAVVESLVKIKTPASKPDLAEQTLVDCSQYNCSGGNMDAFDYVVKSGLTNTANYPYREANGRCKVKKNAPRQKVKSWAYVGSATVSPTTEQIKTAIKQYGVVSVVVAATNSFMAYSNGVYNKCDGRGINHMVNLVGWNDADGAWIMRNSWGPTWGEQGYMRIKYVDKHGDKCSAIADSASFAILE